MSDQLCEVPVVTKEETCAAKQERWAGLSSRRASEKRAQATKKWHWIMVPLEKTRTADVSMVACSPKY